VAAITESVLDGCPDEAIEDVEIIACRALDFATGSATAGDILGLTATSLAPPRTSAT
jgi:hypothetical protein